MKKGLMFFALAAMGLASCNQFKKAPGGLLYDIVVDKPGPSIQVGDFVSLNFIIKNDADSVVGSSYDQGQPSSQLIPKSQGKGDVIDGLLFLSEGDSAVLKINIDSLTHGTPRAKGLKGKYMIYDIKIVKVIQKGNLSQQVFMGRCQAYISSLADAAKKKEPGMIKNYIATNNLKVTTTASGLNYVITKQGAGDKPAPGDTVSVYYVGKFMNGKAFDTNIKSEAEKAKLQINPMNPYKPIKFVLGVQGMIPGWNEGLALLNKGSKATFVLPSSLGYGERGYNIIGPYTPLAFDVELVDITHPDPNAPKPKPAMPAMQVRPMPTQTPPPAKK
jgi:FKBP-type peptidyl-prolyl cis-trans isomerase FkpA